MEHKEKGVVERIVDFIFGLKSTFVFVLALYAVLLVVFWVLEQLGGPLHLNEEKKAELLGYGIVLVLAVFSIGGFYINTKTKKLGRTPSFREAIADIRSIPTRIKRFIIKILKGLWFFGKWTAIVVLGTIVLLAIGAYILAPLLIVIFLGIIAFGS